MVVERALTGAALGGAAWTLAEYWLHRGPMHRSGGRDPMATEHRRHHVDPAATDPVARTAAVTAMAALGWIATTPIRRRHARLGPGLAAGWALGYGSYDRLHWNVHHRAPRRPDDARRLRHLDHHVRPDRNFGVTTSWWDRCFGTYVEPERVRLPRRLAPSWLDDDPSALQGLVSVGRR